MSFSLEVKKEIMLNTKTSSALVCGAILSSGSLVLSRGGISFVISSESEAYIEFIKAQIRAIYPGAQFEEDQTQVSFKQKTRTELRVDSTFGRQILTDLGIISFSKDGNFVINRTADKTLTYETEDKINFVKGLFLGSGSISIPMHIDVNDLSKTVRNSGYHMEWNVQSSELADYICSLLVDFDIFARKVSRNESFIVYLKEAENISSLIGLFGAHKCLLELENERAGREMRNMVNRQANCISANIDKSINASLIQLDAIEKIKNTIGIDALPKPLYEVAMARLENPDGSLNDIVDALPVKISKGAVSQRFKKIINLAKEV